MIISLIKVLLIFPFLVYFGMRLWGLTQKEVQIRMAPLYVLSIFFILKYVFNTIYIILFLGLLIPAIILGYRKLKEDNKKLTIVGFIKRISLIISKYFKYIYLITIIFGIIKQILN